MATCERDRTLDGLSLAELVDELATLASHIYAGTCRWLELVGELDRRGDWAGSGCGSCAEWLAWRCALTPRAAGIALRSRILMPKSPATITWGRSLPNLERFACRQVTVKR